MLLINNTGQYIPEYIWDAIKAAVKNGGTMPEELADLFTLTRVVGNTKYPDNAWRIEMA